MPESSTHVIVVRELPTSVSMFSPQLPGFSFGRPTESEFLAEYRKALQREGVVGPVESHQQYYGELPDGQIYAVRWSTREEDRDARIDLARRLIGALETTPEQFVREEEFEPSPDGVVTFVCTLATDTLGWIVDQMDPRGETVTICAGATEQMIFGTTIARGTDRDWPSTDELGWGPETTVSEMIVSLAGASSRQRVAVNA